MNSTELLWVAYGFVLIIYFVLLGAAIKQHSIRKFTGRYLIVYLVFSILIEGVRFISALNLTAALPEKLTERVGLYGLLVLALVIYHLGVSFLRRKVNWQTWALGLIILSASLVVDLEWVLLPESIRVSNNFVIHKPAFVWALLLTGWGIFMAAILWRTMKIYHQAEILIARHRITYWSLGLVLVLGGDVLLITQNPALGAILKLLGAIVISVMVITPKLPDLRDAIRKLLNTIISILIELMIFALGFWGLQFLLRDLSGYQPIFISLALTIFLMAILNPAVRFIKKWINVQFLGQQRDYGQISREFSKRISSILDIKLLSKMIVDLVGEMLDIEDGILYTVDSELSEDSERIFRITAIKPANREVTDTGILPLDSPIAKVLGKDRLPLTISDIEMMPKYRSITGGERTWLQNQKMDVFVPIHANEQWIGMLAMGAKTSGVSYSQTDLNLLETLADQTAVALQNARLVESLVRVNNQFRRAYSAMEEAHTKLERLDRTKSDFISISSHELRTPLTVLSGYSQMLLDDPGLGDNDYYKKVVRGIYDGTTRLHEIVDSMLEVAKIDTRALELQSEPVKVTQLLSNICDTYKTIVSERELSLVNETTNSLPSVVGDPEALQKVFYHLISNAIKYTPDGGQVTISGECIEVGRSRFPGGGIEIIVRDTGIGIDPRFKELIFSKFYQTGELALHSSGKTKFKGGGPGLGLAIVRGIVQAHGGRVWAESAGYDEEKTPGSQFHVILPTKPEKIEAA